MAAVRLLVLGGLLLTMLSGGIGCQLLHDLQPYRLQRLNRGSGMQSGFEAYYSVNDPLPIATPTAQRK